MSLIQQDCVSVFSSVNTYLGSVLSLILTYSCKKKSHDLPLRFLVPFDAGVAKASWNENALVRPLLGNSSEIRGSFTLPSTTGDLQQSSISNHFWNWPAYVSTNFIQYPWHFLWWGQRRAFGQPPGKLHAPLRYLLTRTKIPTQAHILADCMGLQNPSSPSLLQTVNTGWVSSPRYDSEANALCRPSKGQALDLPNCTDSTHAITQPMML